MNIQNIQSMSQNVDKTYGMLNELDSNGLELMDLAIPNRDGVQDSLEYEIIKYGYRYIDNGDGTFNVCYDHAQDSFFDGISSYHVATVKEDDDLWYIDNNEGSGWGEYPKADWSLSKAIYDQCIDDHIN